MTTPEDTHKRAVVMLADTKDKQVVVMLANTKLNLRELVVTIKRDESTTHTDLLVVFICLNFHKPKKSQHIGKIEAEMSLKRLGEGQQPIIKSTLPTTKYWTLSMLI